MCGIAGIIAYRPLPVACISQMTEVVRHRGPDDEGFVVLGRPDGPVTACGGADTPEAVFRAGMPYAPVCHIDQLVEKSFCLALGHRRLSVVDLSPSGHQPMCYLERYWITYNGEIYNFMALRSELENKGYAFHSHSDTEVILAAYDCWGEGCQHHFNGMWAFAIYDSLQQTLFLSRDRFGVKPFYYWFSPDGFLAFGSEIKQFTSLPGWYAAVNGQRASDYLVWGLIDHTDETMFAGVFQLQQGHCCTLNLSTQDAAESSQRLPARQWYDLPVGMFSGGFEEASAELQRLLIDSTKLRSRADVPVGSCLSGGLDSSSIVCMLNNILADQHSGDRQNTFSACSEIKRFDEREWIDIVVDHTRVTSHYVYPDLQRLFEEVSSITWHQDEPFGSTSIFAQWNVFRQAADNGVKVMLDGQGADESLAGYHTFFPPYLMSKLLHGQFSSLLQELQGIKRVHGYSYLKLGRLVAALMLPDSVQLPLKRFLGLDTQGSGQTWLNYDRIGGAQKNPFLTHDATTHDLKKFSRTQLLNTHLPMLLHWEDRDSMAHSVESRLPFLDYRIVELALTLPDDYKISGGMTKRVLRESMKGILPEPVRMRVDKLGFVTPEEYWLRNNSGLFRDRLQQAVDASCGILCPSVHDVLDDVLAGRQPFSFLVWRMISFGQWMERFSLTVSCESGQ